MDNNQLPDREVPDAPRGAMTPPQDDNSDGAISLGPHRAQVADSIINRHDDAGARADRERMRLQLQSLQMRIETAQNALQGIVTAATVGSTDGRDLVAMIRAAAPLVTASPFPSTGTYHDTVTEVSARPHQAADEVPHTRVLLNADATQADSAPECKWCE